MCGEGDNVVRNQFSDDDVNFIIYNPLKEIIKNHEKISKKRIIDKLCDIVDEIDRFC